MEIEWESYYWLVWVGGFAGFLSAFGIGANDVGKYLIYLNQFAVHLIHEKQILPSKQTNKIFILCCPFPFIFSTPFPP